MKTKAPAAGPALRRKVFVLGVVCLFLVLIVTALFGKKGVMDLRRARRTLTALEAEVRSLEKDLAALRSEIELLEKDPRAVEKAAREKLGLAAPGEKVIVLPRPDKK